MIGGGERLCETGIAYAIGLACVIGTAWPHLAIKGRKVALVTSREVSTAVTNRVIVELCSKFSKLFSSRNMCEELRRKNEVSRL
jgi:hypothetical protein